MIQNVPMKCASVPDSNSRGNLFVQTGKLLTMVFKEALSSFRSEFRCTDYNKVDGELMTFTGIFR